ncbi:hypothetical protein Mlute_00856 [Meiothermus luteus]|jgi:hypothetical protein|uniref:Uncharacterized protein n=1 Tax=Meiothermus luteus TaxID=2026184 RepID=A0A399EVN3_9DEIN|nr:hypothetical protein Mlute_00856 [Meiothermus luteus]
MKRLLLKLALWALHRLVAKRLNRSLFYRRTRKSRLRRLLKWLD